MSAPAPARPATVVTIQYLRGIAASLVVLHHAFIAPSLGANISIHVGEFGVDLFFVISGFIMWTTTAHSTRGPLSFWAARILRVVPLYWIFTALYVAVAVLRPGAVFNPAFDPLYIVKSFLFVPAAHPSLGVIVPVYSLGWTLNYEMFFYLLFGLCLFIPSRAMRMAAIIGALALLVIAGLIAAPHGAVVATYTNPILLEFAAGIMLAVLAERLHVQKPAIGCALIGAGVIWLAATQVMAQMPERAIAFGVPAAAIVAGALVLEPWARLRPNRLALLIGDASYSIYLAHPFAQRTLYFAVSAVIGVGSSTMVAPFVVAAIVAGICGGILSYLLIERPILWLGKRIMRASARAP